MALCEGTELLGEYLGSGRTEPSYLIRRTDGSMIEVSSLLYLVAAGLHPGDDLAGVARHAGDALGRPVSADDVAYLVEHKLRPLGIVAAGAGPATAPTRARPVLGLAVRAGVVPKRVVGRVAALLRPLFLPPVVAAVLVGVVVTDGWLLLYRDAGLGTRDLMLQPALMLSVVGLTLIGAVFHELGHATASRYGGAEPGVIGMGVYLLWPVFYNDLNDSYRLSRRARLRSDLGGVYFNAVFIVVLAGLYAATGWEALGVAILVQHIAIAQQFLPFLRLDGYYVVSDLAGVPDLFGRVRPTLSQLLGRGPSGDPLADLTPRARAIVAVWIGATVPLLVSLTALLLASLPGFLGGAWSSVGIQAAALTKAVGDAAPARSLLSALQIVLLAVPFVGLGGVLLRIGAGLHRQSSSPDMRRRT